MSDNKLDAQSFKNEEPLVKLSKGRLMFSVTILYLLFVSDFVVRLGINAIFPTIQADLALTDSQVGLIASVVLFGMAAFVLPVSYLSEKISKKKAVIGMSIFWSLASLVSGFTKGFPAFVLSRFCVGVGNSSYAPVSTAILTSWFKRSQWGKVVGIYNTAITVGISGGAALCGVLAASMGWRGSVIAISLFSLVVALLSFYIPKAEAKTEKDNKISMKLAALAIIKNKTLLITSVTYGFGTMAGYAFNAWLAIYCVRIMGMSVPEAAGVFGLIQLTATLGHPIGGFILDRWYKVDMRARSWIPAISFTLTAFLYAAGFAFQMIPLLVLGKIVFSVSPTCVHTASQDLVPQWFKAVSYGIVVIFLQGFGAIGPLLAGLLSDNFGLMKSLIGVQALFLVSALGFVWAGLNYRKDYANSRKAEEDAGIFI